MFRVVERRGDDVQIRVLRGNLWLTSSLVEARDESRVEPRFNKLFIAHDLAKER